MPAPACRAFVMSVDRPHRRSVHDLAPQISEPLQPLAQIHRPRQLCHTPKQAQFPAQPDILETSHLTWPAPESCCRYSDKCRRTGRKVTTKPIEPHLYRIWLHPKLRLL